MYVIVGLTHQEDQEDQGNNYNTILMKYWWQLWPC